MPQEQTFILNCPHCTGQVECNIEWINRKGECPYCHNKFIIQPPPSGPGPAETAAASCEGTQRESSGEKTEVSHDDVIKKWTGAFLSGIFIRLLHKQIEGLKDEGVEAMNFYRVCCACFAFSMRELISDHFPLPRPEDIAQQVKDVLNRNDSAATLLLNASSAFDKLFLGSADPKLTQDANGEEMDDMTLVAVYLTAIGLAYGGEFKRASKQEKLQAMQAMRSIARKGMESIENGEHGNWNKVELPQPPPGPAETAAVSCEDTQRESSSENLEESQDEAIKSEICEFLAAILIKLIRKLDQGTEVEFYMLCCACFAFNMKELISTHFRLPQDEVIVQSVNDIMKRSPDILKTATAFFFKWGFYKTVHESGDEREKARFAKLTEEVEGEPLNDMTLAVYLAAIEGGCYGVLKSSSRQEKLRAMQAMKSIARKGMASIERGEVVNWSKVELP